MAGPAASAVNALIHRLADVRYTATNEEVRMLRAGVVSVGFATGGTARVGRIGSGVRWQGRVLAAADRLPIGEAHYIRHVLGQGEWPPGTDLPAYERSIASVILHERSGVLLCRYLGAQQVTFIGRSGTARGPGGGGWIMVEYRVEVGGWVTAFQPRDGLAFLVDSARTVQRWLQRPV